MIRMIWSRRVIRLESSTKMRVCNRWMERDVASAWCAIHGLKFVEADESPVKPFGTHVGEILAKLEKTLHGQCLTSDATKSAKVAQRVGNPSPVQVKAELQASVEPCGSRPQSEAARLTGNPAVSVAKPFQIVLGAS